MVNSFIEALSEADRRDLCVKLCCTTCACSEFRAMLHAIPELGQVLQELDLDQVAQMPNWSAALYWAFRELSEEQQDGVLSAWLPHARRNLHFTDHLVYYIFPFGSLNRPTTRALLDAVVELALQSKCLSLVESLVWRLGRKVAEFPALLNEALRVSRDRQNIYDALAAAEFCIPRSELMRRAAMAAKWNRDSERATRNIFGAVRRNDQAAVQSLLAKYPDLTARNAERQTAAEYAAALGRTEIQSLIESSATRYPNRYDIPTVSPAEHD